MTSYMCMLYLCIYINIYIHLFNLLPHPVQVTAHHDVCDSIAFDYGDLTPGHFTSTYDMLSSAMSS